MMLRVTSRMFTCISPVGTMRLGWSGKSFAVITAFTPASASAFDVSIDLMTAWACGLRSTLPISWPGRLKSAPKRARPVTLSAPSGRSGRVPIHLYLPSVLGSMLLIAHRADPLISAATSRTAVTILS